MSYLNILRQILETGEKRVDRTKVGTKSIFGAQIRVDLSKGFPAITTKKLAWKAVVSELLWFIEGSGDEFRLREILHGHKNKKTIWTDNATASYWVNKKLQRHPGDLGRVYGVQWRSWRASEQTYDQLANLIANIKTDPYSRRHVITAWNPGEIELMAIPPCHVMAQFYVSNDNELSCHMYQRSADMFLGVPFNIASYALFTSLIASVCELSVGHLIISFGDAHIYDNHVCQVKQQLTRTPLPLPALKINRDVKDITGFKMTDIKLVGYQSHEPIKAPMAV